LGCLGVAWLGLGLALLGLAWIALAWLGLGLAWLCLAWPGFALVGLDWISKNCALNRGYLSDTRKTMFKITTAALVR
jgi:hypothetical protein